jgi:type III secretion protein R
MNLNLPDPIYLIAILVALSLAPFVAIMVTSFVKLVVVLSLVRNALGVQQIPNNTVINGLAIILSIYIMAPTAQETYEIMRQRNPDFENAQSVEEAVVAASEPIRQFLIKHTDKRERRFFQETARQIWPKERAAAVTDEDLMVLVPAFTVSELVAAFQIGFLIYLPFIVIDLIVSNVLLSLGMMMVSPMTISLPFKLLLFVLADGWTRLIHGLVLTYV